VRPLLVQLSYTCYDPCRSRASREIGVIKAIGGSNKKVIGQFIIEALTLTVIGSIVGLTFGVLVSGPMTTSLVSSQTSSKSSSSQTTRGGFESATGAIRRGFGQIAPTLLKLPVA